ncbi:MAG: plasmid partition protein ParG [Spirulinaceae cyanobacterium]
MARKTKGIRVEIDEEIHTRLKAVCVLKGTNMTDEIEKLITRYTNEELPKLAEATLNKKVGEDHK